MPTSRWLLLKSIVAILIVFLTATGPAAMAAASNLAASAVSTTTLANSKLCETTQRLPSMGAFFELQIVHSCEKPLDKKIFVEIQNELSTIEAEMSLYQTQSPIRQLNKQGYLEKPPKHLVRVLTRALEMSQKTNGVFDVTVQNPKAVGWRHVLISNNKIKFKKIGQQITLDGIAKGYAVDQVVERLIALGYKNFLTNFSGNMRWQGRRADNQFWQIRVWNPLTKSAQNLAGSESGAIASSGSEHNGPHIIDPVTGQPQPSRWAQTTVIGDSAEVCDVLSTAIYLLDQKQITALLQGPFKGYKVHAIDAHGRAQRILE